MHRQGWLTRAAIAGVAGLAAACSAVAPGSPGDAASPVAASANASQTVPATPTPAPTEPFTIHTGRLPAGTYLQAGFDPPLSFTLGDGWRAFFDDPGELYVEDAQGFAIGASRLENVVDPVKGGAIPAPEDLGAWLEKHPALEGAHLTTVTVAGMPATLVEAKATRQQDVYAYPGGNFRFVSGARYRIYVVPMDGPNLVITTMGPAALFDANAPKLKAIIDSLRIVGR